MPESFYQLTKAARARLHIAIRIGLSIPFVEDIEDFMWEAVFHYVKSVRLPDPIREGRSKRLFDCVDPKAHRGWSLKSLQWNTLEVGTPFEFVIQRADIFKKAKQLGFDALSPNSPEQDLGLALIRHWNGKLSKDAQVQGVADSRMATLLKSRDREHFVYVEVEYPPLNPADFEWRWSDPTKQGLQGWRNGVLKLRWYPNQKQLFECFNIPEESYHFTVTWTRLALPEFVDLFKVRRRKTSH